MTVRKKILIVIIVLFSIVLAWYLFVKKDDYIISFKEKAATQTIFQGIQEWTKAQLKSNNENYVLLEKRNFDFIKQQLKKDDSDLEYSWEITPINDSITAINIGIKDNNHSLYNRISAPFLETKFKVAQIEKIKNFKKGLEEHLSSYKVKLEGEGTTEETFVAYIKLKSVLQEKAQTMIMNDAIITGFLQRNAIKIIGKPYVQIENWDLDTDNLEFNYCFPVDKNIKIIEDNQIKFKTIPAIKGLKATYFGNFRTSDRAWFCIFDYAKKHSIELEKKPLEHFMANPFNGGTEIEWETKIIIPFRK